MDIVALGSGNPPLLILELLIRLKVREVMSTNLVTATRRDTLRRIQHIMKDMRITGVPIVEHRRLFGLVSIDDIINALENGTIEDAAEKHMSTHMVVLDENMPLSLAISYFRKFSFGRFPVLNKDNEITGILTSRDINVALLHELTLELDRMETSTVTDLKTDDLHMFKVYHVGKYDFENAGKASTDIKRFLKNRGVAASIIRRVAVAAYELEMNQVVHSDGGTITCRIEPEYTELVAQDTGPGIENVEEAMKEGVTTANEWIQSMGFGAGMGLPNARRVANEFHIESSRQAGTKVRVLIRLNEQKEDR